MLTAGVGCAPVRLTSAPIAQALQRRDRSLGSGVAGRLRVAKLSPTSDPIDGILTGVQRREVHAVAYAHQFLPQPGEGAPHCGDPAWGVRWRVDPVSRD